MPRKCTFVVAMKEFFGLLPGQKLTDFMVELKALNDNDKAYFQKGLEQNGYEIVSSTAA